MQTENGEQLDNNSFEAFPRFGDLCGILQIKLRCELKTIYEPKYTFSQGRAYSFRGTD